ncbi:MAG: hypothetical protein R3D71_05210 [Rickettsiales bacterium]
MNKKTDSGTFNNENEIAFESIDKSNDYDDYISYGVSANYLSSRFLRSKGDIEGAIKALNQVYFYDKNNISIANQLMGLYLLNGEIKQAIKIAYHIYKYDDKNTIASLLIALEEINKNNPQKAEKILSNSFSEEKEQLWLPLIYAWLDVEQNKLKKPLTIDNLSASAKKVLSIVNYHLALINSSAGFNTEATENFIKSVNETSRPADRVIKVLINFYDNNHDKKLKKIVDFYKKKYPNLAEQKIKPIKNMRDGVAEVMLTMGSVMLAANIVDDSILYLRIATYLKPDMDIATVLLSQSYSKSQQYEISNKLLSKIQKDSPLYVESQLYIAINFRKQDKDNLALEHINGFLESYPDNIDAYIAKGDLLRGKENFADAIDSYKKAIILSGNDSNNWSLLFSIATSYDKLGKWYDAERNLKLALKINPEQPDVLNYLGYSLLMRNEKLKDAKNLIHKAVLKRPNDPQILDSMGWALYMLGDYKNSITYLEKAINIMPADKTINEHLGDVYWRLNRKIEARFQWDRSLVYSEDEVNNKNIIEKIKNGLPESNPSADSIAEKKKVTAANTVIIK